MEWFRIWSSSGLLRMWQRTFGFNDKGPGETFFLPPSDRDCLHESNLLLPYNNLKKLHH